MSADLVELNQTLHDHLERLWMDGMVAATRLLWPEAKLAWESFSAALAEHAALEDRTVVSAFRALGDYPRGATPEIVDNEHRKLARMAADGRRALDELAESAWAGTLEPQLRQQMVLALPRLQRVHDLLEHHTLREQQLMYPALMERAEPEVVEVIRSALAGQAQQWLEQPI